MSHFLDYDILKSGDIESLRAKILKKKGEGWHLYGSPFSVAFNFVYYCQAMILPDPFVDPAA